MKPNPLVAALFMIFLILTLVVLLRSVLGEPVRHHAESGEKSQVHEQANKAEIQKDEHIESSNHEESTSQEESH